MDEKELYERFFKAVFDKAKKDSLEKSKSAQAAYIAQTVFKEETRSDRTLIRLYNKYVSKSHPNTAEPKTELLHTLAKYIGYENFLEYLNKYSKIVQENKDENHIDLKSKEELQEFKTDKDPDPKEKEIDQDDLKKREAIRKRIEEINQREAPKIIAADPEKKKLEKKLKKEKKEKKKKGVKEKVTTTSSQKEPQKEPQIAPPRTQSASPKKKDDQTKKKEKRPWVLILVLLVVIFGFYLFYNYSFNDEKEIDSDPRFCVAWQDDYYVRLDCQTARNHPDRYQAIMELENDEDFDDYKDKRKIEVWPNSVYFETETGEPLVWYYPEDDDFEFFNFSGKHPTKSGFLIPVTQEFVNDYYGLSVTNEFLESDSIYDEGFNQELESLEKECETNQTGGYTFENKTNGRLQILCRPHGTNEDYKAIYLNKGGRLHSPNKAAGRIDYSVYFLADHMLLIESSNFWLNTCDTHVVVINGFYEVDPIEETRPYCETNQTGDFSFKNGGSNGMRIRITKKGSKAYKDKEITLAGKELKWLRDLPTQDYSYSAYTTANNDLIQRGSFTVLQCKEGEQVVDGGSESNAGSGGEASSSECEAKKLGDYCFTNNWSSAMHVRIGYSKPGSHLTSFFRDIDIESGATGCFYDQPAGTYNVYYYPVEISARTLNHHRNTQMRIVACQAGKMALNF